MFIKVRLSAVFFFFFAQCFLYAKALETNASDEELQSNSEYVQNGDVTSGDPYRKIPEQSNPEIYVEKGYNKNNETYVLHPHEYEKTKRNPSYGRVYVKGYYRKDGTYVSSHYRRKPSSKHLSPRKKSSGGSSHYRRSPRRR